MGGTIAMLLTNRNGLAPDYTCTHWLCNEHRNGSYPTCSLSPRRRVRDTSAHESTHASVRAHKHQKPILYCYSLSHMNVFAKILKWSAQRRDRHTRDTQYKRAPAAGGKIRHVHGHISRVNR